ncbi:MAG TPA: sugar phosphorylase [Anaerolineales bacterium]|nr:sugar phosphorylase [Anaerolineales bacterium]
MGITSGLPSATVQVLADHLTKIYGPEAARSVLPRLTSIMQTHRPRVGVDDSVQLSQKDVFLITYPDQVIQPGKLPLQTLHSFLRQRLSGLIGGVHILPFFPSSSDDGFSVVDYLQVDPRFGTWDEIAEIAADFKLMLDGVINHASARSAWYLAFLRGEVPYKDYFITVEPQADLSGVVRPRALPLLTQADTASGPRSVWTTFSPDQIDLNFANPDVLLQIVGALLFYVDHGARVIRLDAIAYLWKEIGTSCIHLPQTHRIVKLLRVIFDALAPGTLLISETNVPHADNISYFGQGDEAHLVYQFPLPPLVLHTFLHHDATHLTDWARTLEPPPPGAAFFNFLASHDGIGLNPARGILSEVELEAVVARVEERGGAVSYRSADSGQQIPYELNISYLDALTPPEEFDSDLRTAVSRILAAHSIILSLRGVPGIYFHSLFGSRNDHAGVERTGAPRSINREKLSLSTLEQALADDQSLRSLVFSGFTRLLRLRVAHPALSPYADQQILSLTPDTFGLLRRAIDGDRQLLCLHNVTDGTLRVDTGIQGPTGDTSIDLLSQEPISLPFVPLEPYQVRWIEFRPAQDRSG